MSALYRAALALALVASACAHAPTRPVPEPFPEALAWTRPSGVGGGAFLGLKTEENDTGSLDALTFEPGVRVTRVVESSPAARAGFQLGDVVLTFAGEEVDDPEALDALVREAEPGSVVTLGVRRGDGVYDVEVALAGDADDALPPPELRYHVDRARSRAGWITDGPRARLVASDPDAPFPRAGIDVGSFVTAVEGEPVHSARDLIRTLGTYAPGSSVEVTYTSPDGREDEAKVRLFDVPRRVTKSWFPILWTYKSDPEGENVTGKVLDFYFFSLFKHERKGEERYWRILIFAWRTGVGELSS